MLAEKKKGHKARGAAGDTKINKNQGSPGNVQPEGPEMRHTDWERRAVKPALASGGGPVGAEGKGTRMGSEV